MIIIASLSLLSCGRTIDGQYELKDGDCFKNLSIRSVGKDKYNIILIDEQDNKVDILGVLRDNTITADFGYSALNIIIMDNAVLLLNQNNRCRYERAR